MSVSHLELCAAAAGPPQHRGSEGKHTAGRPKHRRCVEAARSKEANVGADRGKEKNGAKEVERVRMSNEKRLVVVEDDPLLPSVSLVFYGSDTKHI